MAWRKFENIVQQLLKKHDVLLPPIPVKSIAENLGVRVKSYDLGDNVSGVLVVKQGIGTIGVNEKDPPVRKRFTIAHELGHYILHQKKSDLFIDKKYKVHFRDSKSTTGEYQNEREANAFAAALLMPQNMLIADLERYEISDDKAVSNLARKYKVSELAMSIRISNLNFY